MLTEELDPFAEALQLIAAHLIIRYIMEMFDFRRKNAPTVIPEDVEYIFNDWEGFFVKEVARVSLKMQCTVAVKASEFDCRSLDFIATAS